MNPLKKPVVNAASLKEEGARILNVFTKTKEDLVKLNEKQADYLTVVNTELEKLNNEKALVLASIEGNKKVVSKIEEFLK